MIIAFHVTERIDADLSVNKGKSYTFGNTTGGSTVIVISPPVSVIP